MSAVRTGHKRQNTSDRIEPTIRGCTFENEETSLAAGGPELRAVLYLGKMRNLSVPTELRQGKKIREIRKIPFPPTRSDFAEGLEKEKRGKKRGYLVILRKKMGRKTSALEGEGGTDHFWDGIAKEGNTNAPQHVRRGSTDHFKTRTWHCHDMKKRTRMLISGHRQRNDKDERCRPVTRVKEEKGREPPPEWGPALHAAVTWVVSGLLLRSPRPSSPQTNAGTTSV